MTKCSLNKWINSIVSCVGPYTPIKSYRRLLRRPIDYPVHIWGCTLATDGNGDVAESSDRMSACGVALNPKAAMASALGEACERYAFSHCPLICEKKIIYTANSLKNEDISNLPFLLSPFAESVLDIEKTLHCEKQWLPLPLWNSDGIESDERIVLPISMLFADYSTETIPASTTGMAAGPTIEFAVSRAICEIVERDAFMCSWFHRYAGSRINLTGLFSNEILSWIHRLRECNVDFRIHDISSDLTPFHVFIGYAMRLEDGIPVSFACGAGCSLDPFDAAKRAFLETALSWRGSDDLLTIRGVMSDVEVDSFKPASFSDHAYLYQHERALQAVSHFLEQEAKAHQYSHFISKSDANISQYAIQSMKSLGYDVYVLDTTPDEFETLPIKVVRVVIPGLVPLSWGAYQPPLTKRLLNPRWIPSELRRDSMNSDRHPFP